MAFGQWLTIWLDEFCGAIKPRTKTLYRNTIEYRIKPYLGHISLSKINPAMIQKFYKMCIRDRAFAMCNHTR